ncbi:PREDICTED: putative pumilio homolog 10 [Camelina sativa]|uniref:Pumilio homolog 10 n=1 Tax=Camelina sativa TaxID=90675 RepID=A0ABM0X0U0_CAMSA|nr:PREDICTED: putative pumilio homolog 10 [Camelina sativa]
MFGERFMGFGEVQGDSNLGRASDHRLPHDFGSGGFLQSLDTNPFLKNQCYSKSGDALDLCTKLNKMGISCDMSIWTKPEDEPFRVDPGDFGSGATTLHGSSGFDFEQEDLTGGAASQIHHDGFRNFSSVRLQNNNFHGASSPEELRLLGFQGSFNPNRFEEMMAFKNVPIVKRISPPSLRSDSLIGNDEFKGSLMAEGNRFYQTIAAMEGSGASYPEESTQMRRYLKEDEPKINGGLPLNLVSMINSYGSVNLMAKDQIGCRVLQKLVEEGTFHEATKVIFHEIIDHVVELSLDPFGNYIVQKLLDVSDEEQRTLIVSVLTLKPRELIRICLDTYGTRVVQKMIETVKTKQQIALVKSGLRPGFLALVTDLNGNHVIQSCLEFLGPNDNKFVFDAATKYCAEIAVHRHGCCVLQCCLINSVGPQHERLVAEISRNALHLSQDPFGNYVVQCLIEQEVSAVKLLVQFRLHYAELATQKFSSHVIEKCLSMYPESRAEIVRELLSVPNFEYLLQDPYANYVIQTALSVTKGAVRARLVEKVDRFGKLQSNPYCKKIFSKSIL